MSATSANHVVMQALLEKVVDELFTNYNVPPSRIPARTTGDRLDIRLASVIGFSGRELRGTLMLAVSPESLQLSKTSEVSDKDWLGELGNQLLGRLKNQLAGFEVDITMSTPLVIRGERLSPTVNEDDGPHRWALQGGEADVWFDVEFTPGFTLQRAEGAASAVAEGESMMF